MRKLLFFIFIIHISILDAAADPIKINSDINNYPVGRYSDVLFDPSGQLAISDITSPEYNSRFKPHDHTGFNFGMTESVIWIRFMIDVPPGRTGFKEPVLTVDKSNFPYVDLYLPQTDELDEQYRRIRCSYLARSEDHTYRYRYPVFELPRDIPHDAYLFLRINPCTSNKHASSNFTIILSDKDSFVHRTWLELTFFNLIFGVLLSMIVYNFFLSLFLKSRAYYLYIIYVTFIFSYIFLRNGFNILAGYPGLTNGILYAVALAYIFGLSFSQRFLATRKFCPILNAILWVIIGLSVMVMVALLFGHPKTANTLMHIIGPFGPIAAIIAGLIRLFQGFTPARYYLAAWFSLFIGTIIVALIGLGLLPENFLTINSLSIGSALEAILLSTALGERIRMLRMEKKELLKKEHRLTELSIKDELTGLFNKRWFSSKLLSEIEHNRRLSKPLSLMILDVDHFKHFNDSFGHAAGDKVLAELGRIISTGIRDTDIGCRYGGEEFAVIMPGVDIERACGAAERIRTSFASSTPDIDLNDPVRVTVSIGVAELADTDDEGRLFEKADQAMYQAKNGGRNRVARV